MTQWNSLDPGKEKLILVGPTLGSPLSIPHLHSLELESTPQIAVDGGSQFAHHPFLWVGDGDSGSAPKGVISIFKESQNETDLRFCLTGIRNWHWTELHLFGFLGQRRDHELANWGEVYRELKLRPHTHRVIFHDETRKNKLLFFPAGKHEFSFQGRFSVISFEETEISLSGACQFPVSRVCFPTLSSLGVSNHADGTVFVEAALPIMITMERD